MSLKALLVLLENPPPVGAMPLLGITCVRLAGRALCPPLGADESEAMNAGCDRDREYPATALEHLVAIQVGKNCSRHDRWILAASREGLHTKEQPALFLAVAGTAYMNAFHLFLRSCGWYIDPPVP